MRGRNEHSQSYNASTSNSNPQMPKNARPSPPLGPIGIADVDRSRVPRDLRHEFESSRTHADHNISQELGQGADNMLREQLSNPVLRSNLLHENSRFQQQQQYRRHLLQRPLFDDNVPPSNQPPSSTGAVYTPTSGFDYDGKNETNFETNPQPPPTVQWNAPASSECKFSCF
jgi:serine/arginine repetitive matrix protein 2